MAFVVDGWRTGVLNPSCSLLCALSWSWKCSAWSCMSASQTTKIWQSGNHTRSQNNWLAMVIMHVLWLRKGLTGTEFGKCRWFSRNLSNAQDFVSGSRAGTEEGSNFNESIVSWDCSNKESRALADVSLELLWFCPSEYTVENEVFPRKMGGNPYFKVVLSNSFSNLHSCAKPNALA